MEMNVQIKFDLHTQYIVSSYIHIASSIGEKKHGKMMNLFFSSLCLGYIRKSVKIEIEHAKQLCVAVNKM